MIGYVREAYNAFADELYDRVFDGHRPVRPPKVTPPSRVLLALAKTYNVAADAGELLLKAAGVLLAAILTIALLIYLGPFLLVVAAWALAVAIVVGVLLFIVAAISS